MSIFLLTVLLALKTVCSLFSKNKPEESSFRGEFFCRNRSHLLRLERIGEIFMVDVNLEAAILLQCKFCDEVDSRNPRLWYRQNHTTGEINEFQFILSGKKPRIKETEMHSFINYNVTMDDIGLYYCKYPYEDSFSSGFNFLIDVVNKTMDPLNGTLLQWKNYSDEYLMPVNNGLQKQFELSGTDVKVHFEVFSSWSDWTFCEICIDNPHQYQIAHCRVRAVCLQEICSKALANGTTKGEAGIIRLLLNTSTSLPCRGQLLQHFIPQVSQLVQNIPDFRHNQSCEKSCPLAGGPTGSVKKMLLNLEEGQSAIIPCSGQHGLPKVKWEYNKRKINPKEWNKEGGHVLVDHFGTLHLNEIDKNVKGTYRCFSHEKPILEVKIRVRRKAKVFGNGFFRHFKYLLSIILLCFIIFLLIVVSGYCRMKFGKRKNRKFNIEDGGETGLEPLLSGERADGDNDDEMTETSASIAQLDYETGQGGISDIIEEGFEDVDDGIYSEDDRIADNGGVEESIRERHSREIYGNGRHLTDEVDGEEYDIEGSDDNDINEAAPLIEENDSSADNKKFQFRKLFRK